LETSRSRRQQCWRGQRRNKWRNGPQATSLLSRITPLTPGHWVSPSRYRSTCFIWKKLKCKKDWTAVYQCPCGFTFFNRCWIWPVSLVRNEQWIFINSSVQ
jgi:hypothetical protein